MEFSFLHVSDFHYEPNWPEAVEPILLGLAEDVAVQCKQYSNLHLICSGDLVRGAQDDIYAALLERLGPVLEGAGISHDRRICVPGNHDVSHAALAPDVELQFGALGAMTDETLFNDKLPQLTEKFFSKTFAPYLQAEKQFAKYTTCTGALGGTGWTLPGGVGLYCLNTALCSFGDLQDRKGARISDAHRLMIDTRSLNRWLAATAADVSTRILVMHHPTDWLAPWACDELDKIIAKEFSVVFCGHSHKVDACFAYRPTASSVQVVAPPLFTRKASQLGYAYIRYDSDTGRVDVSYRQWCPSRCFVTGTSLSATESGVATFAPYAPGTTEVGARALVINETPDTRSILQAELQDALVCYSSKHVWVDRDLAASPETDHPGNTVPLITHRDLLANLRSCVIRAPWRYGLTSLGRRLALDHWDDAKRVIALIDVNDVPNTKHGACEHVDCRCEVLHARASDLAAIIVDNAQSDKKTRRVIQDLQQQFPGLPLIVLQSIDDCAQIAETLTLDELKGFDALYLCALSRPRIRELVNAFIDGRTNLDDDLLTKKVAAELEALNAHRTPLNCLLLLKVAEQMFDYSPVNRTEMLGRVLVILFLEFDQIPRYATRPDLKDCEYALGYFCERLIRGGLSTFTKSEFFTALLTYCNAQLIDIDIEVLFAFLVNENLLIRRGPVFAFRFSYWLHFFAAHRMHHSPEFAEFMLSERRYSAFPELIEFYAGIDRRRIDAVARLTADLEEMNSQFISRTGIPAELNPFGHARWRPGNEEIEALKREVKNATAESALPTIIKDLVADAHYDPSKPYRQGLAGFIDGASLKQLMHAMRGAARVLRNSDHVSPEAKTALLEQVMLSWKRVCQILVVLSRALACERSALFEDICFVLGRTFEAAEDDETRWALLMSVIPGNVVRWFEEDLFSRRMGPLLSNYTNTHQDTLEEFLALLVMIHEKSPGWEKEVQRFIVHSNKNSFYLYRIFGVLLSEFRYSFSGERTRQELLRLAAMSLAKHEYGVKHPNTKLVAKAARVLEAGDAGRPLES